IATEAIRLSKTASHISVSVQSWASTDWPAPTCASPSKVVRKRGRCPGGMRQSKGDFRDPRASVLERLSQAFARLLSHCAVHGDIVNRAGLFSTDQQENRQSAAPAAGRRGHARAGRELRQGARIRVREKRLYASG